MSFSHHNEHAEKLALSYFSFEEIVNFSGVELSPASSTLFFDYCAELIKAGMSRFSTKPVRQDTSADAKESKKITPTSMTSEQIYIAVTYAKQFANGRCFKTDEEADRILPLIIKIQEILKSETTEKLSEKGHNALSDYLADEIKTHFSDKKTDTDEEIEPLKQLSEICNVGKICITNPQQAIEIFQECKKMLEGQTENSVTSAEFEKVAAFLKEHIEKNTAGFRLKTPNEIETENTFNAILESFGYNPIELTDENISHAQNIISRCLELQTQHMEVVPSENAQLEAENFFKENYLKLFSETEEISTKTEDEIYFAALAKKCGNNVQKIPPELAPYFSVFVKLLKQEFDALIQHPCVLSEDEETTLIKQFKEIYSQVYSPLFRGNRLTALKNSLISNDGIHSHKASVLVLSEKTGEQLIKHMAEKELADMKEKTNPVINKKTESLQKQLTEKCTSSISQCGNLITTRSKEYKEVFAVLTTTSNNKLTQEKQAIQFINNIHEETERKLLPIFEKIHSLREKIKKIPPHQQEQTPTILATIHQRLDDLRKEKDDLQNKYSYSTRIFSSMESLLDMAETYKQTHPVTLRKLEQIKIQLSESNQNNPISAVEQKLGGYASELARKEFTILIAAQPVYDSEKNEYAINPPTKRLEQFRQSVLAQLDIEISSQLSDFSNYSSNFDALLEEAKATLSDDEFEYLKSAFKTNWNSYQQLIISLESDAQRMQAIEKEIQSIGDELSQVEKNIEDRIYRNDTFKARIQQFDLDHRDTLLKIQKDLEAKAAQLDEKDFAPISYEGTGLDYELNEELKGKTGKTPDSHGILQVNFPGIPSISVASTKQLADTFQSLADELKDIEFATATPVSEPLRSISVAAKDKKATSQIVKNATAVSVTPVITPDKGDSKTQDEKLKSFKDIDPMDMDVNDLALYASKLMNDLAEIKNQALTHAFNKIPDAKQPKPKDIKDEKRPQSSLSSTIFGTLFGKKQKPEEPRIIDEKLIINFFNHVPQLNKLDLIITLQNIIDHIRSIDTSFHMIITDRGLEDVQATLRKPLIETGKKPAKEQLQIIQDLTSDAIRDIVDSAAICLTKFISDDQEKFKLQNYLFSVGCQVEKISPTDTDARQKLIDYIIRLRADKYRIETILEQGFNYSVSTSKADTTSALSVPNYTKSLFDAIEIYIKFFEDMYNAIGNEKRNELHVFSEKLTRIWSSILTGLKTKINKADHDGELRRLVKDLSFNCSNLGIYFIAQEDGTIEMKYRANVEKARILSLTLAMTYLKEVINKNIVNDDTNYRKNYLTSFISKVLKFQLTNENSQLLKDYDTFVTSLQEFSKEVNQWKKDIWKNPFINLVPDLKAADEKNQNPSKKTKSSSDAATAALIARRRTQTHQSDAQRDLIDLTKKLGNS